MVNIRTKGAGGEREVATDLNKIINEVYSNKFGGTHNLTQVQRNQNQTAVGGCDLIGTYNLAIEIKRQEQLSVNTWWKQCVTSANALGGVPVLLYRQNGKKWQCVINAKLDSSLGIKDSILVRATISYAKFLELFKLIVENEVIKNFADC